jgi:hypothetical protein
MLNVNNRLAAGAPNRQQVRDPLFGIRVIPRSPARIVEALLHIDEQQGGVR